MTTEYYQIPSQQGFLPLDASDSVDPWLAAATSSLSLADWSVNVKGKIANPPSLFEDDDEEASVSWKHVVPMQYKPDAVKTPVAPKQFNSTTSKIDAWSVVDPVKLQNNNKKQTKLQTTTIKVQQQPPQLPQQQQQQQPAKGTPIIKGPVEEKPIEDELSHQNRYKTELCKSFTETGNCRYGAKCQFAHGKEEVRPILRHPKYKTEICKTFHTSGTCPYGIRCRFIHTRSKEESIMTIAKLQQQQQQEEEEKDDDDDGVSVKSPPGIPVPKWSKSWN